VHIGTNDHFEFITKAQIGGAGARKKIGYVIRLYHTDVLHVGVSNSLS